jgi:hypothetical protein
MNATQLKAISQVWTTATTKQESFTAKNMMLEPGKCGKSSDLFYHADGRKFAWVEAKQEYVRYE